MRCPNCHEEMSTVFLSSSHLDHGCFNCGCIVDPDDGHIVGYDDRRTSVWEQTSGRRRLTSELSSLLAGLEREKEEYRQRWEARKKAEKKAEEEKRAQVQARRKSFGQCMMCGKALGFFQRLFGIDRHNKCTEFKEQSPNDHIQATQ